MTMLLFILTVIFSACSCRTIFRPPKFSIKPKTALKIGKKVIEHAPKLLEAADVAVALATANVDPDGYVLWKNLKKTLLPDLQTLKQKTASYGPQLDHVYSILENLATNIKSEILMRTNLTNVVGKVQESIKKANAKAMKTLTVMKKLKGMSFKNEILGGLGATGSSFLLVCALVISYTKYKAEQEEKEKKNLNKVASAMFRNYMSEHQLQNDRFQDVTEQLQMLPVSAPVSAQAQFMQGGQQQEAVGGSDQQIESRSFLARLF